MTLGKVVLARSASSFRIAVCAVQAAFAFCMNVVQHAGLPSPQVGAWLDTKTGRDLGEMELALTKYFGRWVYLTAQTLFLVAILSFATLASEVYLAVIRPRLAPQWVRVTRAATIPVAGLSATVFGLYLLGYVLTYANPEWRAQWSMYERMGYPYERIMHLIHSPLALSPVIAVGLGTDGGLTGNCVPTQIHTVLCVTVYVVWYEIFTAVNFAYTGAYAYPIMFDLDAAGIPHALFYSFLAIPTLALTLICRYLIVSGTMREKIHGIVPKSPLGIQCIRELLPRAHRGNSAPFRAFR